MFINVEFELKYTVQISDVITNTKIASVALVQYIIRGLGATYIVLLGILGAQHRATVRTVKIKRIFIIMSICMYWCSSDLI